MLRLGSDKQPRIEELPIFVEPTAADTGYRSDIDTLVARATLRRTPASAHAQHTNAGGEGSMLSFGDQPCFALTAAKAQVRATLNGKQAVPPAGFEPATHGLGNDSALLRCFTLSDLHKRWERIA